MNGPVEILRTLGDRFQTSASVKSVFGDPVTVGDKTVIPVARIRYGLGAGGGSFSRDSSSGSDTPSGKSGGGGGGGIIASPKGVLEISPGGNPLHCICGSQAYIDRGDGRISVRDGFRLAKKPAANLGVKM